MSTGYERSAASVRNYYKRFLASKAMADQSKGIKKLNKCQMCGEIKRGHICRKGSLVITPSEASSPPIVEPPSFSAEPAQNLLALSSARDGPLLPLAPRCSALRLVPGDRKACRAQLQVPPPIHQRV